MLIIGQPTHRRVTEFVAAAEALGRPPPTVISHRDLIAAPERLLDFDERPRLVRIDSFGEDPQVERGLLELGYEDAATQDCSSISPKTLADYEIAFGEVLAPRQAAFGMLRQLERLEAVFAQRPSWRILQPTSAIARLFDKQACWRMHHKAGLPVPEACVEVPDAEALRTEAKVRGWRSVFVKLRSGSSASCLALYEPGREQLTTSLVRAQGRWFNQLKLQVYRGRQAIEPVLDFLICEGVHAERALPKARRDNRYFDLRVLVVDGEPAFAVERQSPHAITNLHLGGRRGDLEALKNRMGAKAWAAVEQTAVQVAQLHGCFHLGVDIAVLRGFREHAVLEANAFGDLLPNLHKEGLSVYGWQLKRA